MGVPMVRIFDMQSSLALSEAALAAVNALQLRLPRPVTVLITSDEEVGSPTSRELIEEVQTLRICIG